ncbi:LytTR family DNA-binding domain-containing protein [Enterococcus sp. HY326]|uniref:LytTR family DNA-binding domain-containing protein n=1 Tax=Enterococcus sp. HY326 TaxID=2971265 RepID=UPI00223FC6B2|nr:LytTR family DNA-binding domain-containing protein [Enterococcus sp. HY326]
MKIEVELTEQLAEDELEIFIKAAPANQQVQRLVAELEYLLEETPTAIPLKQKERIALVKVETIAVVSVQKAELTIKTLNGEYQTKERLYQFVERLRNPDFLQISKFCVININQLDYLEDSFSGNMLAFLKGGYQESVSRKYLPNLMKRLGV